MSLCHKTALYRAKGLIEQCIHSTSTGQLSKILVADLHQVLSTDVAGCYLFDDKHKIRHRELCDGYREIAHKTNEFLARRFHEHPLCRYLVNNYQGGWVMRVTDVTDLSAFMRSSYFQEYQQVSEMRKPPFEMSYCGIVYEGYRFAFSLSRQQKDFDENERQLAQFIAAPIDQIHMQHAVCSRIVSNLQLKLRGETDFAVLTPREREILIFLSLSLTHLEVADYLRISPRTVAKHLENIFGKLGIDHYLAAVAPVSRLIREAACSSVQQI